MEIIENQRKRNNLFIIIGFLAPIRFPYLPLISPLEIISIIYFIQSFFKSNFNKSKLLKSKVFRSLRILFFLWIGSQTVSDILNKVAVTKSIRGIGIPFLVYVTLLFLIAIYEKNNRDTGFIKYYFLGHSVSFIFFSIINSLNNEDIFSFFKWGVLIYLAILGLILISNNLLKLFLILIIFISSTLLQVRSNSFIFFVFLFSKFNIFQNRFKSKVKDLNIFKVISGGVLNFFFILLLLFSSGPIYSLIAKGIVNISINPNRTQLIREQNESFFDTRLEYYSYFEQFKDSPIWGKGSWAVDKDLKYNLIKERNSPFNKNFTDSYLLWRIDEISRIKDDLDNTLVPVHSFLMQAITWGGILSGLFYFYLLNLNIFMLLDRSLNNISRLYISLNIFNIFFSPLGNNRFTLPIVCFLTIIYFLEKNLQNNNARF